MILTRGWEEAIHCLITPRALPAMASSQPTKEYFIRIPKSSPERSRKASLPLNLRPEEEDAHTSHHGVDLLVESDQAKPYTPTSSPESGSPLKSDVKLNFQLKLKERAESQNDSPTTTTASPTEISPEILSLMREIETFGITRRRDLDIPVRVVPESTH